MLLGTHRPCRAGVFAGAALVFLLALRWGWHRCWLALSPSLRWHPCPCTGATAKIVLESLPWRWYHPSCRAGVCPIVMQRHVVVTELPSWWCCAGILACTALVSLLALAGATISIALVSLPCFASVIALGALASVQLQCCLQHVLVHSVVVESVPLQQRQKAWRCWPFCTGCCLHPSQCPCSCPLIREVILSPSGLLALLGPSHRRVR
jgi:hypothetical protein